MGVFNQPYVVGSPQNLETVDEVKLGQLSLLYIKVPDTHEMTGTSLQGTETNLCHYNLELSPKIV